MKKAVEFACKSWADSKISLQQLNYSTLANNHNRWKEDFSQDAKEGSSWEDHATFSSYT